MDEQRAIHLLKQGDITGLEYLVSKYQLTATRTAYLVVGDADLAQDIVQEAFLHTFHKIKTFDDQRSFRAWFFQIVVNASIKALKKQQREVSIEGDDEEDSWAFWEKFTENFDSIETQVEKRELQQQIWQSLQSLSPRQRAVIVQRYYLGMSEQEMAKQSGSAPGTIKWILNNARERLRKLLGGKV